MAITPSVAIRLNDPDKAALRELAKRLQRNQSETVRVLVRETLAILREQDVRGDLQKKPAQR